jgi:hypothetical protein
MVVAKLSFEARVGHIDCPDSTKASLKRNPIFDIQSRERYKDFFTLARQEGLLKDMNRCRLGCTL